MRVEDVVTFPGFRLGGMTVPDQTERRVILSERDKAQLQGSVRLLEKIRTAIDPNDWDDIRESEDLRAVSLAEVYASEVARADWFVVDDEPRLLARDDGSLHEVQKRSDL